jgi:hypothetical protein
MWSPHLMAPHQRRALISTPTMGEGSLNMHHYLCCSAMLFFNVHTWLSCMLWLQGWQQRSFDSSIGEQGKWQSCCMPISSTVLPTTYPSHVEHIVILSLCAALSPR